MSPRRASRRGRRSGGGARRDDLRGLRRTRRPPRRRMARDTLRRARTRQKSSKESNIPTSSGGSSTGTGTPSFGSTTAPPTASSKRISPVAKWSDHGTLQMFRLHTLRRVRIRRPRPSVSALRFAGRGVRGGDRRTARRGARGSCSAGAFRRRHRVAVENFRSYRRTCITNLPAMRIASTIAERGKSRPRRGFAVDSCSLGWDRRRMQPGESVMAKSTSNTGKPWTPAEVKQLKQEAAGNTPTRVMGLKHKRTEAAIRAKAQVEGISLKPTNQSPYGTKK